MTDDIDISRLSISSSSMSHLPPSPTYPLPPGPYKPLDPGQPPFMPNAVNTNLANYRLPPLPDLGVPPLPLIEDVELERQVFTHSSWVQKARKATSMETEERIEDNEKLEHVGDSLINVTTTLLLHQLYPNLQVGGATMLKGHLVSNLSLSQLSKHYGLPQRIIASASEVWNLRAGEKIQANLFEAYVAALYLSYLLPTASASSPSATVSSDAYCDAEGRAFARLGYWLKPLFAPLCHWLLAEIKSEQRRLDDQSSGANADSHLDQLASGALARLNEHMTKYHKTAPQYTSSRAGTDAWTTQCIVHDKDGKMYSHEATRSTKKIGQNIAAYKVCQEMGL